MNDTAKALDQLISQWQQYYQGTTQGYAEVEHDKDWPSPCELGESDALKTGDMVFWQPVLNPNPGSFDNIESALNLTVPESIQTFYSRYFAGELSCKHSNGPVYLLQVWNDDDFARLQQNIIGHVLMKRRLKQAPTIFFGLTDDENLMISIKVDNGEIWLESVGREPHLKLADSMAEFLAQLSVG